MNHIKVAIESRPELGWFGSILSLLFSGLAWFLEHAGQIAQIIAIGGAVFGLLAGYYTWRIQRSAWRGRHRRPLD
jgi:membrane associated rhomboid family serine protease